MAKVRSVKQEAVTWKMQMFYHVAHLIRIPRCGATIEMFRND